jgi:hypothetical protein
MMIKVCDIVHLPFNPDLTEAGIGYACRSLGFNSNPKRILSAENLRHLVGGLAVELAFRRSLGEQNVPFHVMGATPFTRPDRFDVSLGGHRCDLNCSMISRREQITGLRKDPALTLHAPAMIPLDQYSADNYKPDDVHIFALLLGLFAASGKELGKAVIAGQPVCMVHPLTSDWSCPPEWLPLETLAFKSDCHLPITLELGGQNSSRDFCIASLELPPKKRVVMEHCFHSLAYLQTSRKPEGRIGLYSPLRGEPHIIPPQEWANIWVYGLEILLMGWLSHEEFRRKAKALNAGMGTFQGGRTREKSLIVPMDKLNPLRPLFERVKASAVNPKFP